MVKKLSFPVRLEYPMGGKRIDAVVFTKTGKILIEFKYKKTNRTIYCGNEKLTLRKNGAYTSNIGQFIKDIVKIESLLEDKKAEGGYVIFLTDDNAYNGNLLQTNYKHGATLPKGQYNTQWRDYGDISKTGFRYTIVEIK